MLTTHSGHPAACGIPPAFSTEAADLYIGYFENRYGEQWIFTFNCATREAGLRDGGVRSKDSGADELPRTRLTLCTRQAFCPDVGRVAPVLYMARRPTCLQRREFAGWHD